MPKMQNLIPVQFYIRYNHSNKWELIKENLSKRNTNNYCPKTLSLRQQE